MDVDIQVALANQPDRSDSTFLGWLLEERTSDPVFDQPTLIVHRPTSLIPFELVDSAHWFTRQALQRRVRLRSELVDAEIPVPTPEDFVLLKAAYGGHPSRRPGKKAQDRVDIENVIERHRGKLDVSYIRATASKLGLGGFLDDILG